MSALTPYQRLLASGQLRPAAEKQLRKQYESLSVVDLRGQLECLRNQLFDLVEGTVEDGIRLKRHGYPIRVDGRQRRKEWLRRRAKSARHHRIYVQGLSSELHPDAAKEKPSSPPR